MKTRNPAIWKARFSRMRMHAFGLEQVLDYETDVEIYQARVSPEVWRARPTFSHGRHYWEGNTAEDLMVKIRDDFEVVIRPWMMQPAPIGKPGLLSLVKKPENTAKQA